MTSRERILAAIAHEPVDRVPLCFEGVCHGSSEMRNVECGMRKGGAARVLVKEYVTPKGTLRQEVWKVPDYPHREIPLFSDHNVPPGRSKRYLVSEEA
ncbi:MAG: hypothetical protein HN341_00030, partial [Verrucomicrobia bacterium]|nr:hypothetical protein [Verrucomicrobiota bacterium]